MCYLKMDPPPKPTMVIGWIIGDRNQKSSARKATYLIIVSALGTLTLGTKPQG